MLSNQRSLLTRSSDPQPRSSRASAASNDRRELEPVLLDEPRRGERQKDVDDQEGARQSVHPVQVDVVVTAYEHGNRTEIRVDEVRDENVNSEQA